MSGIGKRGEGRAETGEKKKKKQEGKEEEKNEEPAEIQSTTKRFVLFHFSSIS